MGGSLSNSLPAAPPQFDGVDPASVPKTGKERALGTLGKVLAAGSGRDADSSGLSRAMDAHHQQRVTEANKHLQDYKTYSAAAASGVDPETGVPLSPDQLANLETLREQSHQALTKIAGTNPDIKARLQKFKDFTDQLVKMHPKASAQGASGQPAPATAPQGGAAAPAPAPTTSSAPAPPPQAPTRAQQLEQRSDAQTLQGKLDTNTAMNTYKRKQDIDRENKIKEETAKQEAIAKAKAANPTGRPVMGPATSVRNARELASQGKVFEDVNGDPIDLTSLPDTMGLKFVAWGGKHYYEPFSPNSKTITVGNETYAVSPMDVEALGQGAGTDLGVHRTATSSGAVSGVDATTGATVTRRISTPQTPGVRNGAGGASTPAAPPSAGGGSGTTRSSGSSPSSTGLLPTPANAKRMAPVKEASTQLFGDPNQPDFKGLKDYAYLADNPESAKKVGAAVQLVLNGMEQEEKSSGGLTTLLKNYGGVPQALIESKQAVAQDMLTKMSPEERDAFNSVISSLSSVVGLRSLTGASGAQFSVKALERDVPIMGYNVFNARDYNYKMAKLAENTFSGSTTVPMQQKDRDYIKKQVSELSKSARGNSAPAKPPSATNKNSLDEEIMGLVKPH